LSAHLSSTEYLHPVRSGLIIPMDVSHGFLGSYDDRQQNMLKLTAPMLSVK
jgi:hypothetical protein